MDVLLGNIGVREISKLMEAGVNWREQAWLYTFQKHAQPF